MCSNNPGCTGNVTTHATSWAYCTARVYDASSARNYVGIRPSRTCQAAFAKTWWEECDRLLLASFQISSRKATGNHEQMLTAGQLSARSE
ncbi:unnamed protein product [Fusarium fujikuroi]|uniref:Uncharacterized protein n=1 Tax=Fusarium fujikuroi TaxID=5127 RepID=A0A9Q9RZY3_FUSFU|nr:unnamed protein product [Fusarium fujikuroi]VZH92602.1 unnamed protein product [Fusarium fujikuroi]